MLVKTKSRLIEIIRLNREKILSLGVQRIGIFGSAVREEMGTQSDVDVFVEFAPGKKTYDNFIRLSFLLEELLGRKVDLLTPEALSPHIAPHIVREVEYVSL